MKDRFIKSYSTDPPSLTPYLSNIYNICTKDEPTTVFDRYPLTRGQQNNIFQLQNIPKVRLCTDPVKVLDAPGYTDDFYLNLMDWSSKNIVAIALKDTIYLWHASSGHVQKWSSSYSDYSSLSFSADGSLLATMNKDGGGQIWNMETHSLIKMFRHPFDRNVRGAVMKWYKKNSLIIGYRDSIIQVINDITSESVVCGKILLGHCQEICGLDVSSMDHYLASGGNDNQVRLWDLRMMKSFCPPLWHNAAVKAVHWNNLNSRQLFTGAGTKDQCIRIWDRIDTAKPLQRINTNSQCCAMGQLSFNNYLITCHGFATNDIRFWKYKRDSLECVHSFPGHSDRVLALAISPDESNFASVASDEFLKIWQLEGYSKPKEKNYPFRLHQLIR